MPALPFALALAALSSPVLTQEEEPRTVRARVQPRPGAEVTELDMRVHRVPVDPPIVAAGDARLGADELVLGIERDGSAVAVPIRYLALYEVLNSSVGDLPVAPTW